VKPDTPLKRPWLWSVFGATLLAVPVAATLVARAHKGPPKLGRVPAFAFTDQENHPLASRDLDGKVYVADFIFTSCSQACPRLTGEMAKLQRYLQNRGLDHKTRMLSISVDPARDTPERLAAYAAGFHADPALWKFATGPADAVEEAVVRGFKEGMSKEPDPAAVDGFSILHGTRLVLVDGAGTIRGYYDAEDAMQMARLREDVSSLVERGGS
jgi:protein SCO1/2